MSELKCPVCTSEQVISRRMIHEQGVTNFAALNISTNGNFSTTSGTAATKLSLRHAPPVRPMPLLFGILFGLVQLVAFPLMNFFASKGGMGSMLMITLPLWFLVSWLLINKWIDDWKYLSSSEYDLDLLVYNNSFVCTKCGNVSELT